MSGYEPCGCRDCTDVALGGLCQLCEEAGCLFPADEDWLRWECQREDAYGNTWPYTDGGGPVPEWE